jgi:hypothetical protein
MNARAAMVVAVIGASVSYTAKSLHMSISMTSPAAYRRPSLLTQDEARRIAVDVATLNRLR